MSATAERKWSIFDESDSDSDGPESSPKRLRAGHDTPGNGETKETAGASEPRTPEKTEGEEEESKAKVVLSPAQRAVIEQNRQKALLIRREKMNRQNPYIRKEGDKEENTKVMKINNTTLVDTGGGFFIEETEGVTQDDMLAAMELVNDPAPLLEEDRPACKECSQIFDNSYLFQHFDHPVCDRCRDQDSAHALITRTDAREEYLLKDVDLDKRQPPLRYLLRRNPHNSSWGDMKLYLKLQVEKRALEVWGSEELLEEALVKKEEQRQTNKERKYKRRMKELRMNVRSSLYTRASQNHQHEYGEEEYLPDDDQYSRTCSTCGHSYTYDKM